MTHPTATLDEVWMLFKETDRRFQESIQETNRRFQETDRRFQETDRRFQESIQETNRRFQETDRRFQESIQETNRRFQETDRLFKEMSKRFEETRTEIGQLGHRLGEFVEGLIKPSLIRLFQQRGIAVHKVHRDVEANNEELGLATQIDLLVVNHEVCILIEVKSRLAVEDVNEHLERMEKFKPLFPEYQDKRTLGTVAAMVIPEDVAKYSYRKGLFVIGQQGESAVILNDEKFKPRAW